MRQLISPIVHPIIKTVDAPSQVGQWLSDIFTDHSDLLAENTALKNESLLLKAKLLKYDALEKENTRLNAVLASSFELGEQFIVASLIRANLDAYSHNVIADKGSRFNVFKGQAVLSTEGVIGQVTQVLPLSSEVMLITDPNHAIPVEINRTGLRTIAVGTGIFNKLTLPYLPHNTDIKPGDLLTTSGLGGLYPKGYPVATVHSLTPAPGQAFMRAEADTVAQIESSRELLLVWSNQQPIPLLPAQDADTEKNSANDINTQSATTGSQEDNTDKEKIDLITDSTQ